MTPHEFIAKWRAAELKERSAAQEHFIDLCRLVGEPTPAEADPSGETCCFERGARKVMRSTTELAAAGSAPRQRRSGDAATLGRVLNPSVGDTIAPASRSTSYSAA